jgi:hypothetical protein
MNPRIRLDDLLHSPYKEHIQTLVLHWVRAELPAHGLTYVDYTRTISTRLLTTQSPDQTSMIVQAVLAQATALHKTSEWVDQELKFEGMIYGADRQDFLRLELSQATAIDDHLLDTYNERVNRFQGNV